MINLENFNLDEISKDNVINIEKTTKDSIAVIGMSAQLGGTTTLDEFWKVINEGQSCIRDFPEHRKKLNEAFIEKHGFSGEKTDNKYLLGSYFEKIDLFDNEFFSLSPAEAKLMDPHQRIFLETIYSAIEDAGYSGKKIYGSNTGIFIGYSTDFGNEYKHFVFNSSSSSSEIAVTGNIKSIIAGRIAYLYDLKGPSLLFDTACSSALVAVHYACKSILRGECGMALAGGIKLHLLPVVFGENSDIGIHRVTGIESPDGKTKTFDNDSSGTSLGEGSAVIVLKSLHQARSDGDNIYAVIKGSAVNQDGSSIGITAPNSAAQERLLLNAWKDAEVEPETITYIEAHGTGTKLGDPIEINGLTRAFKNHTEKKQFCAIGSVKSNIGHLDHLAGVAGLIKSILSLKNKKIPPSINFTKPNSKISFEESPVYINDVVTEWHTGEIPRRCGISSFGLSGTNCHIILEEAKKTPGVYCPREDDILLFTMSAKRKDTLKSIIKNYHTFIQENPDFDIHNLCYTANTGREHFNNRMIMYIRGKNEFIRIINHCYTLLDKDIESFDIKDLYFKKHRISPSNKKELLPGEITEKQKDNITREAQNLLSLLKPDKKEMDTIHTLMKLYVDGADINWDYFYRGKRFQRISLPGYPFDHKSLWVNINRINKEPVRLPSSRSEPLLDECIINHSDLIVFRTTFSADKHWVLNEHEIMGNYIVPGTTFLEILRTSAEKMLSYDRIHIENLIFISPLVVQKKEKREVNTILKAINGYYEFSVSSKESTDNWVTHCKGKFKRLDASYKVNLDVARLKDKIKQKTSRNDESFKARGFNIGERWNCVNEMYTSGDSFLIELQLPEKYMDDLNLYKLHPALMDCAVNAANFHVGDGLYLPLAYPAIQILGNASHLFYSYIRMNKGDDEKQETIKFDITMVDVNGRVFVEAKDYTIKKVHETGLKPSYKKAFDSFYSLGWIKKEGETKHNDINKGCTLILKSRNDFADSLIHYYKEENLPFIEVAWGNEFKEISGHSYLVSNSESDYEKLMSAIKEKQISTIVHCMSISGQGDITECADLIQEEKMSLKSVYYVIRTLINKKMRGKKQIILISDYAHEITRQQDTVHPMGAALTGLGRVIEKEYPHLSCRAIDIDSRTNVRKVFDELSVKDPDYLVGYRNNTRYVHQFQRINLSSCKQSNAGIRENGVYVITGGLGGLGIEVARYLASQNKVRIALVDRIEFPQHSRWDTLLENDKNDRVTKKIKTFKEIENSGSEILCCTADISKEADVKNMLTGIRESFGAVHGIFHAAGIAGDGFIVNKNWAAFENVTKPKIRGTWLLDKYTREDNPDFFVMFSSITSITGAPGQSDYTAANAYLDSFSRYRNKFMQNTITINWAAWSETGMALDHGTKLDGQLFKAIGTHDALYALEKIIAKEIRNIIVADIDYNQLHELNYTLSREIENTRTSLNNDTHAGVSSKDNDFTVTITGKDENSLNKTEAAVARIWAKVLGLKEIDIYENFNNLGGNSIIAVELLKEMEKEYPELIDISDIFTYATINEMSAYLGRKISGNQDGNKDNQENGDTIDDVLIKLSRGEISKEKAAEIINALDDEMELVTK